MASALAGLGISTGFDVPGGPAIVLVMALVAAAALAYTVMRKGG